ncbi:MAG: alpha/beta hydrolase [Deltaproteobacteria bacterium]|nr:alpha/beta hydrolase [Deltaproteobacteria bacterium]
MAKAKASGIEIEYETYGDRPGRPLLLIMGLGGQLNTWSEEILHQLVEEGHRVIVFDNRDTGLSSKMEEAGVPDILGAISALMKGEKLKVPYTLYDMGDDAVGLLDALGIEKAHICGLSMGGAIAQTTAISHPSRLASLILINSATGNPHLPLPKPEIMNFVLVPPVSDRNAYIDHRINLFRMISGSGYPLDEEGLRQIFGRGYDRSYYPEGAGRNLLAIFASGHRRSALPSITAPTLVIHGDEDPLVPVENGRDAAEAIPGAELMIIKGMGHYPPHKGPWPQIVKTIAAHTRKASV